MPRNVARNSSRISVTAAHSTSSPAAEVSVRQSFFSRIFSADSKRLTHWLRVIRPPARPGTYRRPLLQHRWASHQYGQRQYEPAQIPVGAPKPERRRTARTGTPSPSRQRAWIGDRQCPDLAPSPDRIPSLSLWPWMERVKARLRELQYRPATLYEFLFHWKNGHRRRADRWH